MVEVAMGHVFSEFFGISLSSFFIEMSNIYSFIAKLKCLIFDKCELNAISADLGLLITKSWVQDISGSINDPNRDCSGI